MQLSVRYCIFGQQTGLHFRKNKFPEVVTCRAGRHRSVGMAVLLAWMLEALGFRVFVHHASFARRPGCGCPWNCRFGTQANEWTDRQTFQQALRPFVAFLREHYGA